MDELGRPGRAIGGPRNPRTLADRVASCRSSNTLEHLGVESDDAIRTTCSPNQCHIPRPYPVSLLATEDGHDQLGIAQSV
jgi:hypothetical protein